MSGMNIIVNSASTAVNFKIPEMHNLWVQVLSS